MLQERLISLGAERFVALTLDISLEHDPPTRQLDLAYGRLIHSGGADDVLELLSEPLPADKAASRKFEQDAKGQDQVAEMYAGKKMYSHYVENAKQFRWRAAQALKPSRLLPREAWYLGGDRLLLEYHLHRQPRWYRVVSLAERRELWKFTGTDLHKALIAGLPPAPAPLGPRVLMDLARKIGLLAEGSAEQQQRLEEFQALQERDREAQVAKMADHRVRVIGAYGDQLLVDSGMSRSLLRTTGTTWHRVASFDSLYGCWPAAAATLDGFVFEIHAHSDQRELLHVDGSGRVSQRWTIGSRPSTNLEGTQPPSQAFAYTSFAGEVVVADVRDGKRTTVPRMLGLGKDDYASARLSPSAQVIAYSKAYRADRVALFDVRTGLAVKLPVPAEESRRGTVDGEPDQVRRPDILVLDDAMLMLAGGTVALTGFDTIAWDPPPPPPPRYKKHKEPGDTIDAAVARSPLSGVAAFVRNLYAPSVALTPVAQRRDLRVGASKFNGAPDLPADAGWPRWRGTPMAFMAQVDLAEVRRAAPDMPLPESGLLSFFLALDVEYPMPSFFSEANWDRNGAVVLWTPPGVALKRHDIPADMPAEYLQQDRPICKLKVSRGGAVLPPLTNIALTTAGLSAEQAQAYEALADLVNGDDEDEKHWGARLGGYPAILQNDSLQLDAESHELGAAMDSQKYRRWEEPEFQRSAQRWAHLLQMSEGEQGWSWGDAGLLHWMVKRSEMPTARFSSTWTLGVCH